MASKAGKSKPSAEIRTVKSDLKTLIKNVLSGSVGKGEAAVAIQGYNALTRTIELERKVRELDDLEARLEELEVSLGSQSQNRRRAM